MAYQIALVGSPTVSQTILSGLAAALNLQAQQLAQVWGVSAGVAAFPSAASVPLGYWPISLMDQTPDGSAGVHYDQDGQPYAIVALADNWPLIASHECMEMIVDPFGNRTASGPSPRADQGQVDFLVEICDPCQDPSNGYLVGGYLVSDFCAPSYYATGSAGPYSRNGSVNAPLQILDQGCLTWRDPSDSSWWQRQIVNGVPTDAKIPGPSSGLSAGVRAQLHRASRAHADFLRTVRDHPYKDVSSALLKSQVALSEANGARIKRQLDAAAKAG